jgi:hypothetical protein
VIRGRAGRAVPRSCWWSGAVVTGGRGSSPRAMPFASCGPSLSSCVASGDPACRGPQARGPGRPAGGPGAGGSCASCETSRRSLHCYIQRCDTIVITVLYPVRKGPKRGPFHRIPEHLGRPTVEASPNTGNHVTGYRTVSGTQLSESFGNRCAHGIRRAWPPPGPVSGRYCYGP